ncbi:radical SAM protein [Candidatus Nitrospira bockiana]
MPTVDAPRFIQIEPVGQCNLRCRMCSVQFREDGPPDGSPAVMPYERFTRLMDQCTGLQELHLQGLGEPLMHPRFFDLVAYAAAKGIRVTTNTNLTLLRPGWAERCVTSGLASIRVSIDGATAETYEGIRVGASFRRVVRNLTALVEARGRLEASSPAIGLVMVVMRRNLQELPALVRLAWEWSVDELFVQHLCHDFGESTLPARYAGMRELVQRETLLDEDEGRIERYFNEASEVAARLGVRLRLPRTRARLHPPGTPGPRRCDWPWRGLYVSYQGLALPCCMVSTPDRIQLGDVAERGIEPVWTGEAYEDFRRRLDSDDPPEVCRSCSVYKGTF